MKFLFSLLFTCIILSTLQAQNTSIDSTEDKNITYEKVEIDASYPGGIESWRDFLAKNLNASTPVMNGAPIGRYNVFVQFIVTKDGEIADIKPLTRHGYGMEEEVIRIIKKTGKWNPAIQNGRPVNAYRKQPVTFEVEDEDIQIASEEPYRLFVNKVNEITISVRKVKPENISVMIVPGTIKPLGEGRYSIKVTKPGKATATIYGKNGKTIGTINFEVIQQ